MWKLPDLDKLISQFKRAEEVADKFRNSLSKALEKAKKAAIKQFNKRIGESKKVNTEEPAQTVIGLRATEAKTAMEVVIRKNTNVVDDEIRQLKTFYKSLVNTFEAAKKKQIETSEKLGKMGALISEGASGAFEDWIERFG